MTKLLIASAIEGLPQVLARYLHNCELCTCSTGPDALRQVNVFCPDVLVIDLMLPGMDGLTVLEKLAFKPPVIIALTNLASVEILQAATDLGVREIIIIPCSTQYLIDTIRKHL